MCQFFCENPFIWGMGCFGVGGGGVLRIFRALCVNPCKMGFFVETNLFGEGGCSFFGGGGSQKLREIRNHALCIDPFRCRVGTG